jgi:hypothetical protein
MPKKKMINVRTSPYMAQLMAEASSRLASFEVRPITQTELIENAVALYHAALVSGNIQIVLTTGDIGDRYRANLARVRGLDEQPPNRWGARE